MLEFLKIALRNLLRHKRRSVLTGIALLTGAFALTFGGAYGDGIERQLIAATIAGDTGHITITTRTSKKTEQDELVSHITKWKEQLIAHPGQIAARIVRLPNVLKVCRRVNMNGMISNGQKLDSVYFIGVEPEKERDLFQNVIPRDRGRILHSAAGFPAIYISHTVAQKYHVSPGDVLTAMAQTVGGSANTMDLTVQGVFKKGALWRENFAYLRLQDAQQLAQLGEGVTQFKIILKEAEHAKASAASLRKTLVAYRLSVKDWEEAGKLFLGVVLINRIAVDILCLVLFIVSMTGIINTMLMAVHERTREIGAMLALGTKRRQIVGLFVTEAALLGLGAAGVGTGGAVILTLWLGRVGIPAFNEAMSYMYGSSRTFPYLTAAHAAGAYLLIVALATAAAFYPAFAAARLKPAEAIKQV